ncbi:homoprotocatechuate degradation operon regulator HpaR [Tropicibacter naphthalenivorans]|uniref:Organic hydroperoxide resistance transcriptional regulator n=1 Tax=Tropicibacter naphthalenivorans TaxID=441103 RepID=A0A0P1GVI1_9RHOB|nr:homoprotocatechuate degradation operon regulator HpaR [Tropicibacter naphthalenivorans]CUH79483.1 Organic hydroperoxide resistance transcriptional regulator [Tropicibacter naphthalenivorans]SMC73038.1 transcriptional regulator, MarR family [Tropicibacter naphthalenivorans]
MTDQKHRSPASLAETGRTLPISLLRAREAVMDQFRPMLSAHDITEQQWRVLRVLQEAGVTDASHLAQRACILAPSLTRMLKALEARGLITTGRDPQDRRRWIIDLTEAGKTFIAGITPQSRKIYDQIEERYGAERLSRLLDELEALQAALPHGG